ncbi:MAG TPA: antibiotic biosynthesis monooxygenase [Vicinamibacterales bacterium]|nr:antibiotic biosynthesis monooxygenase [Vicinamibacterales bacterium]
MLIASLAFRVRSFKRAEAFSTVEALVGQMRSAAGCTRSRFLVDADDENAVLIASEWLDSAAADAFFRARGFRILRGIRILMRDELQIVFDDVQARVERATATSVSRF